MTRQPDDPSEDDPYAIYSPEQDDGKAVTMSGVTAALAIVVAILVVGIFAARYFLPT